MTIQERLNLILEKEGISQADLSRKIDFGKGGISKYFSGKENPGRKFLTLLQEKLNISSDWLLTGRGNMYIDEKTPEQILNSWGVQLDLTESEQKLLAQALVKDKELCFYLFKALNGDVSALDKIKKLLC